MAFASPAFRELPLQSHGLQWIQPSAPLAHPFESGDAILLEKSLEQTVAAFGPDGPSYRRLVQTLVEKWPKLLPDILGPLGIPAHPILLARFGLLALGSASSEARLLFKTPRVRALFAGIAGHSILPLDQMGSAAVAWALALSAHSGGWPIAKGGSRSIAFALQSYFESLGGLVILNQKVGSLSELREADLVLCDITPKQFLSLTSSTLPDGFRKKLERYRYGPGVFKMDWALDRPIPWKNSDCLRAGTVHLGGTLEELEISERASWENQTPNHPYVLLSQPSLFDASRAPAGKHVAWAYCHVPNGSTKDMTQRIESQIERVAPGFGGVVLARHATNTRDMEDKNANLVGGDINGGAMTLGQMFMRPTWHQYRTPLKGVYLCSSSTPPGGGVHGQCGYHAAHAALSDLKI